VTSWDTATCHIELVKICLLQVLLEHPLLVQIL
jgi:hypothetical protein